MSEPAPVGDEADPEITHVVCAVCSTSVPVERAWSIMTADGGIANTCGLATCLEKARKLEAGR